MELRSLAALLSINRSYLRDSQPKLFLQTISMTVTETSKRIVSLAAAL